MSTNKELQVFSFEQRDVRVVMKGSEPWWVAKDIADVLDFRDAANAIRLLDEDEKGTQKVSTPGGEQEMLIISESGLYTLIMRSNKPEAKRFRKWVTSTVLPSIRKTGGYGVRADGPSESMKRADAMLNNSRVRLAKFVRETVKDIWDFLSPEAKQSYSSYVVETATGQPGLIPLPVVEKTYTATELGELFGVSANRIGRVANVNGIKTSEYGIEVLDKAKGHDKQVPAFRYNERGKERLRILVGEGEDVN